MLLYKLNKNKTVSLLYADQLNARSSKVDEIVILTPFTSNITCKIQYYDPVDDELIGRYTALNIASNRAYGEYGLDGTEEGIAFIHEIPANILTKGADLRFSFKFFSPDKKSLSTSILSAKVNHSTWEIDADVEGNTDGNWPWPIMSKTQLGVAKIDDTSIGITPDGILSLKGEMKLSNKHKEGGTYLKSITVNGSVWNVADEELIETEIANKADKATTLAGYGIKDAYTMSQIDSKLTSSMTYKGTVANYSALPSSGNKVGDFYNVLDTGNNYAWDDSKWDQVGGTFTLTAQALIDLLIGDDTVVVDMADGNKKVEIHLDQHFKDTLATKDLLKNNYRARYNYKGDIADIEFYNWCINTPGVDNGELFTVELIEGVSPDAISRGFPDLEADSIIYGWFHFGQLDNHITILTEQGMFRVIDGQGPLTCEAIGGGGVSKEYVDNALYNVIRGEY